jgi:glycosyltransferase involved in cell wall biosynthesis
MIMAEARGRRHVLVIGGAAHSLVNFRGPLIRELRARGFRVTAAAGDEDKETSAILSAWGVDFVPLRLGRTGMNPIADIAAIGALSALMRRISPDVFFGYTIKPVIYGLLAARLAGVPRRIAMITGLGYAFTDGPEAKRRFARAVAVSSYRLSLRFADRVIFQNADDRAFFLNHGLVRWPDQTALVAGSGVDLDHYVPAPLPNEPVTFLMIARLLRDKGLHEYVEAARQVKRQQPGARFVLVGPADSNPAAVNLAEVEAWMREGIIDYRGEVRDVRPEIAACHVYVLPSYREGMPRTVLEAMAMGRAIITTDVPGCRETVIAGENGLLVPPRNADALAEAMTQLTAHRSSVAAAGSASLSLCRAKFDSRTVASLTAALIEAET